MSRAPRTELSGPVRLALVAVWITYAADGPSGVRVQPHFRWRIGAGRLLVLAGLPTLTLALALLLGDTFNLSRLRRGSDTGDLALINMWEETAWSGVVQTRLERRHGVVAAAFLTRVRAGRLTLVPCVGATVVSHAHAGSNSGQGVSTNLAAVEDDAWRFQTSAMSASGRTSCATPRCPSAACLQISVTASSRCATVIALFV